MDSDLFVCEDNLVSLLLFPSSAIAYIYLNVSHNAKME